MRDHIDLVYIPKRRKPMCDNYCIPSIKKKYTTDIEICPSLDFGTSLGEVYPLLQIIFEKLSYDDLKSASQVNNTWGMYANEEFAKRNKASWASLVKSKYFKLCTPSSRNFKYDSSVFGLIFYKYPELELSKYVCVHNDEVEVEAVVNRMTFAEYLSKEVVPADIDYWVLSCSDVYHPTTLQKGYKCSFTGLFVPDIPNVKVKTISAPYRKIKESFSNFFLDEEHVHCTLLFTLSHPNTVVKKFIKKMLNRQDQNTFAVGGGVLTGGIKPFQKTESQRIFELDTFFCIAFTQEKNTPAMFDSYSVVIDDNFEEKLLEFKNNIKLREHSFAIRICCAAKYPKKKETGIFNNIFPNTFVIGFDADGEIGWNKFNSWQPEKDIPEPKKSKIHPEVCHQYTTIIVIMTWGKEIE